MSGSGGERVLLVEDNESLRKVWSSELSRMGFQVRTVSRGDEALPAVVAQPVDVVLLDLNLPGKPGMEVLSELLAHEPSIQVIVCTGHGTVPLAVEAMRQGAVDFLTKPVNLDVLEKTVRRAVSTSYLVHENERLRRIVRSQGTSPDLRGGSPAAKRLHGAIERIGPTNETVLVLGESGSGKELVARKLHALSPRRDQPFVAVNCGAMPRQLMESELFGHVKGAFTGADSKRMGLFEAASGGTLFLDEVAELPIDLQPALLRALQFGEIRPVGSDQVRKVDVRVLAATHRDLQDSIATGRFRQDLFYRLAVLEVEVPPLRERQEDIPALAEAFLQHQSKRLVRDLQLTPAAIVRLKAHSWPGNIRELENAMLRLAVMANVPEIGVEDIEMHALGSAREMQQGPLPTIQLRELESLAIDEAMRRFAGNKRKAAEALGVALKTLYNKLNAAAPDAVDED